MPKRCTPVLSRSSQMLDFQKLIGQIEGVGSEAIAEKFPLEEIKAQAREAYLSACGSAQEFSERMERDAGTVLWPVLTALEPFGTMHEVLMLDEPVTVVATDGSQIMP